MLLCEFIMNSTRAPPSEAALYHTLLQLYLAGTKETQAESEEPSKPPPRLATRFAQSCPGNQSGLLKSK